MQRPPSYPSAIRARAESFEGVSFRGERCNASDHNSQSSAADRGDASKSTNRAIAATLHAAAFVKGRCEMHSSPCFVPKHLCAKLDRAGG